MSAKAEDIFDQMVELQAKIAGLRESFLSLPGDTQEATLVAYFRKQLEALGEEDEVSNVALLSAEMLSCLSGRDAAVILGEGLAHANPDIRLLSGEALVHMASHDFDNIMPAVDALLEAGGVGAEEMIYVLESLDDADVVPVLERFLAHEEADVTAAAIEVLMELGDDSIVPALNRLVGDEREVSVEEELDDGVTHTVGQLAKEALEVLSQEE